MSLIFFSPDERIAGHDTTDGEVGVPCIAFAYDQDEPRLIVADLHSGQLRFIDVTDFAVDIKRTVQPSDDGVYINSSVRKLLEDLLSAGATPRQVMRGLMASRRRDPTLTPVDAPPTAGDARQE